MKYFPLFFGLLILTALLAGCASSSSSPASYATVATPRPQPYIDGVTNDRNSYGWLIVKGYVVNPDSKSHSIEGYVDFYDKNDVKFDHCLFFIDVDAHGKTAWDVTSTKAEDYPYGVTYKKYIQRVY